GGNYTWSKTITYNRNQFVNDYLLKNVTSNRPQAVNVNWGYDIPGITKWANNLLTRSLFDDWHLSGVGVFYNGQALAIGCSANGAPPGYWTGTPTGGFPFRCQQTGSAWLTGDASPASVWSGSNSALSKADPKLWYNFNPAAFTLPPVNSFGIGNEQPTITYGPGIMNFDMAMEKSINVGTEAHPRTLSFRFEAYNVFNHFNPGNPNTTLNINCNAVNGTCTAPALKDYTSTTFGTITSAAIQARHAAATIRFRF
ncbi:MAG TPA: hypothetical protein DEQ47_05095, partial [Solibacterales bacterium]|nr:hypothetical protein [Bryobacterales bacterium]